MYGGVYRISLAVIGQAAARTEEPFWSARTTPCRTHFIPQLLCPSDIRRDHPSEANMADSEDDDYPFDWKSGDLTTWLKKQPGAHINPKIQLTDLRSREAGRGVGNIP